VGPTTSSTLDFALAKSPAYYIARKPRQVGSLKLVGLMLSLTVSVWRSKFDSDEDDGDDDNDNKLMNDDGLGDDYSLDMAEAYRSSLLGKAMTTIQEVKDKSERGELAVDESLKQEYASSWLKQFFVLSFRNLRDLGRNPMVRITHDTHGTQPTTSFLTTLVCLQSTYVLVIQTLFMGLLMGSIYFDLGLDQSSIQVRGHSLIPSVAVIPPPSFLTFHAVRVATATESIGRALLRGDQPVLQHDLRPQPVYVLPSSPARDINEGQLTTNRCLPLSVLQERDVFNRERAAGVYSTSAYFVAKNLVHTHPPCPVSRFFRVHALTCDSSLCAAMLSDRFPLPMRHAATLQRSRVRYLPPPALAVRCVVCASAHRCQHG
jgi:hypothetical protein